MKRKRVLLVIGVCVFVLAAAIFALWPKETEPTYQGKSLSEWERLYVQGSEGHAEIEFIAREALQSIGTNALPHLLRWIQFRPRPIQRKIYLFGSKLSHSQAEIFRWMRGDKNYERAAFAPQVFAVLRGKAAPAVPELVRLMNDTNHPAIAARATRCLQEIGREDPSGILPSSRRF